MIYPAVQPAYLLSHSLSGRRVKSTIQPAPASPARGCRRLSPLYTRPHLTPGGDMANLEINVVDEQNVMVANGIYLALVASNGTISPTEGYTAGGLLHATFTSGASTGTAQIIATTSNGITATTEIVIEDALPTRLPCRLKIIACYQMAFRKPPSSPP